jgi:hypothetical protein
MSGGKSRYSLPMPSDDNRTPAGPTAGLCALCSHARRIESDRSAQFILCGLSATDSAFPKYPSLPVLRCPGYTLDCLKCGQAANE